jgi:predicted nucleic acid-binding protein
VATADATYVDPSALLKLYIHEPESAAMSAWRSRTRGTLTVTHHGRVEILNGVCLAAFRGYLSSEALADTLASLDEDFTEGRYAYADVLWRATLRRAGDLCREYTRDLGCRTLDVLHIASALELGFKHFVTFDLRQQQLVRAVGLKLIVPSAGK